MAEIVIKGIDWTKVEVLGGSGDDLAAALAAMIRSDDETDWWDLWFRIEGTAFAQSTIAGAAEQILDVLLAALADGQSAIALGWIDQVLNFILKGGSTKDPGLPGRCRDRARRGLWLLAHLALEVDDPERTLLIEIIGLLDQEVAGVVRRAASDSPSSG